MEEENKENKDISPEKAELYQKRPQLWKPGQSGNPLGKPKGTISLVSMMKAKLNELGPDQKRTYAETFAENLLQDALEKDDTARKLVLQYIEGLPQQKMELTHILPKPLDDIPKDHSLQEDKGYEEEDKSVTGGDSSIEDSIDSNIPNS